jgi:hypothetical protein
MKGRERLRGWLLSGLAGVLMLGAAASGVHAQTESSVDPSEQSIGVEPDRAIGVFGAMLCGGEGYLIRTDPLLGMNPYLLAAGIGGCLLALMDVCSTE